VINCAGTGRGNTSVHMGTAVLVYWRNQPKAWIVGRSKHSSFR
jgi:hypothetical protein